MANRDRARGIPLSRTRSRQILAGPEDMCSVQKSSPPDRSSAVAGVAISPARHAGARLLPPEVRPGRPARHHDPALRPMRFVGAAAQHGERLALHPRASSTARGRDRSGQHRLDAFIVSPTLHFAPAHLPTSCERVIARRRSRRSCSFAHHRRNDSMTSCKALAALLALAGTTLPCIQPGSRRRCEPARRAAGIEERLHRHASMRSNSASRSSSQRARRRVVRADAAPRSRCRPGASGSTATAFNPAISLILGGSYTNASQDPETWRIAGFMPSGGEVGPGERSFNLGESELTLSANVDPYFSAKMTAAITAEDEIEVEEAFFRTLALPSGFTAKGGRFFSGFGYLNEVHAHAWDFVDQPLVYQAFFGGQFTQDGVQVKWLAPTDLFVELGAETGNGSAFPATRRNRNGLNGATLFAHVGGDVGDATSWRAGAAWLDQRAEDRTFENVDEFDLPVIEFVHRQVAHLGRGCGPEVDAARRRRTRRQLKLQGEYMHRARKRACSRSIPKALSLSDALSQRAVRLVPAGRVSVPAALARGPALRLARLRHAAHRAGRLGRAVARRHSRRCCRRIRIASRSCSTGTRASSRACARSTTGTTRAARTIAIARSACNTSTASARTARTSTEEPQPCFDFIRSVVALLILAAALPAHAALKVLATTADWGALVDRDRRRSGQRLRRDQRAAGRASRRCQAESGRARAHGGSRRRNGRGAGNRLAAGAGAGVRQPPHPARQSRLLRSRARS